VFVTRYFDWHAPDHRWLQPLSLPLCFILASLLGLLLRTFWRATVLEIRTVVSIVFILEFLMLPAASLPRVARHPPQTARPATAALNLNNGHNPRSYTETLIVARSVTLPERIPDKPGDAHWLDIGVALATGDLELGDHGKVSERLLGRKIECIVRGAKDSGA
jgi:hypothetical protein